MTVRKPLLGGGVEATLLVTGAGGFIGSRISVLAASVGIRVLAHSRRTGPGITWIADLRDECAVRQLAVEGIGSVIHCAAAVPARSVEFMEDNARSARILAGVLKECRTLRRIVNLSSVSVYRLPPGGPFRITEKSPLVDVNDTEGSSYALSKRVAEQEFDRLTECRPQLGVVHLRPSSVYGRGMVASTLLPTLVSQARNNAPVTLRGPRGYMQNFVNVADVAELALRLANESCGSGTSVINAFSDDTFDLHGLAEMVRGRTHSHSRVIDQTTNDPFPDLSFDNHKAKLLQPSFRRLHDHLEEVT